MTEKDIVKRFAAAYVELLDRRNPKTKKSPAVVFLSDTKKTRGAAFAEKMMNEAARLIVTEAEEEAAEAAKQEEEDDDED